VFTSGYTIPSSITTAKRKVFRHLYQWEDVVSKWTADFKPIQRQAENISTVSRGKAVHTIIQLGDDPSSNKSITRLNIRNNMTFRQKSSQGMIMPTASSLGSVNERARIQSSLIPPIVSS
jgi:hypothetical protein